MAPNLKNPCAEPNPLKVAKTAKTEATIVIIPKSLCGSNLTTAIDEISPQIFAINSEKNTY